MLELRSSTLRATFHPLGARIVSLFAPDAKGSLVDVAMGGGTEAEFRAGEIWAGAVCGRVTGRIAKARFPLEGRTIELTPNEGTTHLHGGPINFSNSVWRTEDVADAVRFTIHSPDGDQGYPGALDVSTTYRLAGHTLSQDFEARTTKTTIVNLTNHAYWNLRGKGNALDHEIEIDADRYIPLDDDKLPVGELAPVAGTRWDFRKRHKIAVPYDHAFCLNGATGELKKACTLFDPASGRTLEIWSTGSVLQFYTANHWNASLPGKSGPLEQYDSVALELQHYPDALNHPNFPPITLRPGETYRHRIEWRFAAT
jgi:aldose 1-epimerase